MSAVCARRNRRWMNRIRNRCREANLDALFLYEWPEPRTNCDVSMLHLSQIGPVNPGKSIKNYYRHHVSAIFYCTPTILQATSVVYWHQGTLLLYDHVLISNVQALAGSSSSVPVKWNKQKPSSLLEYCRIPFFITYSWISQSMLSRFLLTGCSLSTFLTSKSMKCQSHEQFPAIVYTKQ